MLARQAKSNAARHQHPQPGAGPQEAAQRHSPRQGLLEVVEDEQELTTLQRLPQREVGRGVPGGLKTHGLDDGRDQEIRVHRGGEGDERRRPRHLMGNRNTQSCLADPSGARQGDQPDLGVVEHVNHPAKLALTSDDRCRRSRQGRHRKAPEQSDGLGGTIFAGRELNAHAAGLVPLRMSPLCPSYAQAGPKG